MSIAIKSQAEADHFASLLIHKANFWPEEVRYEAYYMLRAGILGTMDEELESPGLWVERAIGEGIWGAATVFSVSFFSPLGDPMLHTGVYVIDFL